MLIAIIVHNIIWVLTALHGISAINSKQSKKIKIFMALVFFLFITRLGIYGAMHYTMNKVTLTTYCNAVYQGGLYILEAILESFFFAVLLFLIRRICAYIEGILLDS